ncbi:MAG: hypothetical protein EBQ56_00285 [Proteobacteria bacterium]|nr:hypothetical protein [Pseudomonadota bacterium]
MVERGTDTWEFWFGLLEAYVAENGHSEVQDGYLTPTKLKLGSWVRNQRTRRATLGNERALRLEQLPGWTWSARHAWWEIWFTRLALYVAKNGDCLVPASHETVDGHQLGTWVGSQRARRASLSEDRRNRLEALPGWTWDVRKAQWETGLKYLKSYVVDHTHSRVPVEFFAQDSYPLGSWVHTQRTTRTSLSGEKIACLEAFPGWTWDTKETQWEEGFARLEAYREEKGDCLVPANHVTGDDYRLGKWVNKQRTRRATMTAERKSRLEALPGWIWNARDAQWEEGFQHLKDYIAETGHCHVPIKHVTLQDFGLGAWVNTQRTKRASVSSDRSRRLEALPGWTWNVLDALWEERYEQLEAYVTQHGHSRVPRGKNMDADDLLGSWVIRQRGSRRTMTSERRQRLENLPGWTWDIVDSKWDEAFGKLAAYATVNGDCLVASGSGHAYELGRWVGKQRSKRASMTAERRGRLEALPGWTWDPFETQWEDGFARLETYLSEKGGCLVPAKHVTDDGFKLGQWVSVQRTNRTTMPAERKRRLEALPGWAWDAIETQWEEGFARLQDYVADKGDCRVPANHVTGDGYRLGSWVIKQRSMRDTMPAERKRRLEAVPGWTWHTKETQWEEGFARLEAYVAEKGDCLVPAKHVTGDGYKLGQWVNSQRTNRTTMPAERRGRLEALPGWTWDARDAQWEEGLPGLRRTSLKKGIA